MQQLYKQIVVNEFNLSSLKISIEQKFDLEILKNQLASSTALIKLLACPINPIDLQILKGTIPGIKLPFTPGSEGFGIIVDCTDKNLINSYVSFINFNIGSWREYQIIDMKNLLVLPPNFCAEQGACAFVNPFTSYALIQRALSYKSKGVLNLAANSSLGHMVNKLSKYFGLNCLNVIRGNQNRVDEMKKQFENEFVISQDSQDFSNQIKQLSEQLSINICFDPIGGSITGQVFNNLPQKSVVIIYGSLSGKDIEGINGVQVRWGQKRLEGLTVINWMNEQREQDLEKAKEFIKNNLDTIFKTKIYKAYSFNDVQDAIQECIKIGGGQKIILKP